MTCKHVQEKLLVYAAGDLSPEERRTVEAHLQDCLQCRREADAAARSENALSLLATIEPAPDLTRDLHARIAARERRWGRWALAASAVAAIVLAAALTRGHIREPATPGRVVATAPRPAVVASVPPENKAAIASDETVVGLDEDPQDHREPEARSTLNGPGVPQRPIAVAARSAPVQTAVGAPTRGSMGEEPALPYAPEATEPTEPPRADEVRSLLLRDAVRRRALAKSGVMLLVGRPAEKRQAKACYIEITLPDGTHSVAEHGSVQDMAREGALVSAESQ